MGVVGLIATIIGITVGLAGFVSVVLVLGKQKALESSFALTAMANDELRSQVEAGRTERHTLEIDMQKQLADERAECARSLGVLQGQVDVLTSSLGQSIAQSVVSAVGTLIESARADLATKVADVKADTAASGILSDAAEGRRIHDGQS